MPTSRTFPLQLIAGALALLLAPASALCQDFAVGDLYYTFQNGLEAEVYVSGLANAFATHVIIPSTVQYDSRTCRVTSIGYGAIVWFGSLTSVSIGDNVTSIGGEAFGCCHGLTSVSILGNVTNDWDSSHHAPFRCCENLATLVLGEKMTKIGTYMFSGCNGLTSVTIGKSVRSIGNSAFSGCSSLTNMTIPDSVTSVGLYVFENCSGLKTLSVPGAWEGTTMLANASVPSGCEVVYRQNGSDLLPKAGTEAEVAAALAGAVDGRLEERIASVAEYEAFRAWVSGKELDAEAVMGSAHAWISYAMGTEGLFENEPEIVLDGMSTVRPEAKGEENSVALKVAVTVRDGGIAVMVDAAKVTALFEATSDLRDWDGKTRIPVTAIPLEREGPSMKFRVQPDSETTQNTFLRIAL
jgi:hypothetical protein